MEFTKRIYSKFSKLLVNYSTKVSPGDVVIIENFDIPHEMTESLIEEIQAVNAHPIVWLKSWSVLNTFLKNATETEIKIISDAELAQMKHADVYISIRASYCGTELNGVPRVKQQLFHKYWLKKVHYNERISNTRWVSSKWPTKEAAENALMSLDEYKHFFLKVCLNVNYKEMDRSMDKLVQLLDKTDSINIVSPGTNIFFNKKGIPSKKCSGNLNIPDGEVYTAPIKRSVNGYITYNIDTEYFGHRFKELRLTFKNGKIINSTCKKGDKKILESIFKSDKGASYIGEFALGMNPLINKQSNDRMFDEKMNGSIHLTPGNSYDDAGNGNKSCIHWDLILNQTREYGGGEIYFDNILIRKDGLFTLNELKHLNPNNLKL